MKPVPKSLRFLVPLVLLAGLIHPLPLLAQHGHLNAGAHAPEQNSQLYFVNGASFVEDSGFAISMNYREPEEPYGGYYSGTLTLSALAATPLAGGPAPGHATIGSHIVARIETVDGPEGGIWGFWESNWVLGSDQPTYSVPVGTTDGVETFALSENEGLPEDDPFGHIHGRRFTVNKPGLYTVGFRLLDTSTNGDDNGPIHAPGDLFRMRFLAVSNDPPDLTISREGQILLLEWTSRAGKSYRMKSALSADGSWETLGDDLEGTGEVLQTQVVLTSESSRHRFFQLEEISPEGH